MADVKNLIRQHNDVLNVIGNLKRIISGGGLDENVMWVANEISMLAGKLKIHLNTEDNYMYPDMLKSDNVEIRSLAQQFIEEMKSISTEFMTYKNRFNTKMKILSDTKAFVEETDKVFRILEGRIEKENKFLYPIL